MTTQATTRGTTSVRTGSAAMARMASSCSVTRIEPSSAASDPPTRPASMTAASTGPICLVTAALITPPICCSCPSAANWS